MDAKDADGGSSEFSETSSLALLKINFGILVVVRCFCLLLPNEFSKKYLTYLTLVEP